MGKIGRSEIFENDLTKMSKGQHFIGVSKVFVFGNLYYSGIEIFLRVSQDDWCPTTL
jgi:hypothetical protein